MGARGRDAGETRARMARVMPEMAEAFVSFPLFGPPRCGDWDAVMKAPRRGKRMPPCTATWRYARALALKPRGDRTGAGRERAAFETASAKATGSGQCGITNTVSAIMALACEILAAEAASVFREGNPPRPASRPHAFRLDGEPEIARQARPRGVAAARIRSRLGQGGDSA